MLKSPMQLNYNALVFTRAFLCNGDVSVCIKTRTYEYVTSETKNGLIII